MAELPNATTYIDDVAGFSGASNYVVVMGCAESNADIVPRVFSSTRALLEQHGYSQGVDYSAIHMEDTKRPVIFVGLPVSVPGSVTDTDDSLVTGTSTITVTSGPNGIMEEVEGVVRVITGGDVGTDGIELAISIDNERSDGKRVRLGALTAYTIPYVGIVVNFGPGTLVLGDVFKFRTTAPMFASASLATARNALAAQQKSAKSWIVPEEMPSLAYAQQARDQVNAYETANERFVGVRLSVKDKDPNAKASRLSKNLVGSPELTFAEVGATGDTITRASGSWITDGFAVGDAIQVSGTVSNNITAVIAGLTATVITLGSEDLVAEVVTGASVLASPAITFAEVGASADTITRSSGSWIADGFKVGQTIEIAGTASNNITAVIAGVSATVITLGTEDLTPEVLPLHKISIVAEITYAAHLAQQSTAFGSISDERRVNLGYGRARGRSPITQSIMRRPCQWAICTRSYQRDLHIPTWKKGNGPLSRWSVTDENDTIVEYDETAYGGALANRFTCLRTYQNGPEGAFAALDLTRAPEGSALSLQHNMDVANLVCTIVQYVTEGFFGETPAVKPSGKAEPAELKRLASRVNGEFAREILSDKLGQGPRASSCVYAPSNDDILVPTGTLNGVSDLNVNGTIAKVNTAVRVRAGGI